MANLENGGQTTDSVVMTNVAKIFKNPTKYINEYHYIFWSHKEYDIPLCLNVLKWFFLIISVVSVIFSLYSLPLIGKNINYINYGVGIILFFISTFVASYIVLHIQKIVNLQIIRNYKKIISENTTKNSSFELKSTSRKYVEAIRRDWIRRKIGGYNIIGFAELTSSWQKMKKDTTVENKTRIRNFFHNSRNNYHTYILALFSLCGLIIIGTGDANIFYQIFSIVGLKYYLLLLLLGIEIKFLMSITGSMAGGIMNNYDDFINDLFKMDDNPSDLRVKRFVNVLLNYNPQKNNNLDDNSSKKFISELKNSVESKLEKKFKEKSENMFEGRDGNSFKSSIEEVSVSITEKRFERKDSSNSEE